MSEVDAKDKKEIISQKKQQQLREEGVHKFSEKLFNWQTRDKLNKRQTHTPHTYTMGQTLSEPVTEKESAHCQNDDFAVSRDN